MPVQVKMNQIVLRLIAAIALAAAAPLRSETPALAGEIHGYVRSQDGRALPGAYIEVTNVGTGFTREAESGEDGYFAVQILPPGIYSVTASRKCFYTCVRSGIQTPIGRAVRVDIELPVGILKTVIEVREDPLPTLEIAQPATYMNVFTEREARNIPLAARNPLQFYAFNAVLNSPRVPTGGSGTATPSLAFAGYGATQFNVDGMSNNLAGRARNVVISAEAIAGYQTQVSPPAEFGRTAGAILNATSRSGGNDWHGSLYLLAKNKVLAARPPLLDDSLPTPPFERYNYGATLSGPIVRDRSVFFLNYERWTQDQPMVSTFGGSRQAAIGRAIGEATSNLGEWQTTFRAHTVAARGDVTFDPMNRLMLRYNLYRDTEAATDSGPITREVSIGYRDNPQSGAAQLTTVLSPSVINEARFLYGLRPVVNPVPDPNKPAVAIAGIGTFNGNADGQYQYFESGFQLADTLSWTRGRQLWKAGFEVLPVNFQDRTRDRNGSFLFAGVPAAAARDALSPLDQYLSAKAGLVDPSTGRPFSYSEFSRSTGQDLYDATLVNTGFFLQDEIRFNPRWRVNAGVRYEVFVRPAGNLNPAYPQTGTIRQDLNNVEPRIGVAWNPRGWSRTVLRAGYGIYQNPTSPLNFSSWLRQNGITVKSISVLPGEAGAPAFTQAPVANSAPDAVSNLYQVEKNYHDGLMQSWSAGVQHELLSGLSLTVSYLGAHISSIPYGLPTNLNAVGALADGRLVFDHSNRRDPRAGIVYSMRTGGTFQDYHALLVTLNRRLSRGLSFQTGYQYQHIYGCFDRSAPTVSGACFDRGPSSMLQPNRFTTTAVWEPSVRAGRRAAAVFNGWMFSLGGMVQNGLPYTPVTGQDDNGDRTFSDRPAGFGLNNFRMLAYVQFDLRLRRMIALGELGRVEVFGECANSTNNANIYSVNTVWGPRSSPVPSFGEPTNAEMPRQWQLGLRYSF